MASSLPQYDKRTTVVGSTGSGKTQFAVWLLSTRDFNIRPWIIFDFKGDALISEIGATEIPVGSKLPREPGLYITRPIPGVHDAEVTRMLWDAWAQEDIGIYIDEGYMIQPTRNPGLNACLTQGRSKHIEMIILSQRPVLMSKMVFSEASYFAVFNLTMEIDRKTVAEYLDGRKLKVLPKYHCLWYDVERQEGAIFMPVPDAETLIETFKKRLNKRPVLI